MDLNKIFGEFAGKEVDVIKRKLESGRILVENFDKNDPTIKEIFKRATENGLSVRVWLTKAARGTMDRLPNRLNVIIPGDDKGVYRIRDFRLG